MPGNNMFRMFAICKNQRGFTLVELLVVLIVLGILLGIAMPQFRAQLLTNKSQGLTEDLLSGLAFARAEAVRQAIPAQGGSAGRYITLCVSVDGNSCSPNTGDWNKGFIAVVDYATAETAGKPELTDAQHDEPTILRVWEKPDDKALISVKHMEGDKPISFIRYTSQGKLAARTTPVNGIRIQTKMADPATQNNCAAKSGRQIDISVVGIARLTNSDCWK